MRYKLCKECGSPLKPKGVRKKPDEFDHAMGCPADPLTKKFKVGDRVRNRFKREDGTMHNELGVITRLWGKIPYAATVNEDNGGAIRARLTELILVKSLKSR